MGLDSIMRNVGFGVLVWTGANVVTSLGDGVTNLFKKVLDSSRIKPLCARVCDKIPARISSFVKNLPASAQAITKFAIALLACLYFFRKKWMSKTLIPQCVKQAYEWVDNKFPTSAKQRNDMPKGKGKGTNNTVVEIIQNREKSDGQTIVNQGGNGTPTQ